MSFVNRRYFLTAVLIVSTLIGLVAVGRIVQGRLSGESNGNVKVKGPQNAPIHLVVYSDFQCPACRLALDPIDELRSEFSDALRIEFRHFPLERSHRWALTAALFAECAAQQGKFWEFHDQVFEAQPSWSVSEDALVFFAQTARGLKLDPEELERCIGSREAISEVKRDRFIFFLLGVRSTPTVLINRKHTLVGGAQIKEQGRTIILDELKRLGRGKDGS